MQRDASAMSGRVNVHNLVRGRGIGRVDDGPVVPHKQVANWLSSWVRKGERKAPRV
jgi:hypothetical protein